MITAWQQLLARPGAGDHVAQVYRDPGFLAAALAHYVSEGLRLGEAVLVVVRSAHWEACLRELRGLGRTDLAAAQRSGQLTVLWAEETLPTILSEAELIDPDRFHRVVGSRVARLQEEWPWLRVFGEMVDLLWQEGRCPCAVELEELWNELIRVRRLSLLCAYGLDPLHDSSYGGPLEAVCQVHSHLVSWPEPLRFDEAVWKASRELLQPTLADMLPRVRGVRGMRTEMGAGQAAVMWVMEHMPLTGVKLLARAREIVAE